MTARMSDDEIRESLRATARELTANVTRDDDFSGRSMRAARVAGADLSLEQLAERMRAEYGQDLNLGTLARYERGDTRPTRLQADMLEHALRVPKGCLRMDYELTWIPRG